MGLTHSQYQDQIDAVLTDSLLTDIRQRAAGYDERNEFPYQDIAALQEAGYFAALTPVEDGGLGWNFAAVVDAQKKLAMYSPATALAVNMHLIWSGVAAIFQPTGITTWILFFRTPPLVRSMPLVFLKRATMRCFLIRILWPKTNPMAR